LKKLFKTFLFFFPETFRLRYCLRAMIRPASEGYGKARPKRNTQRRGSSHGFIFNKSKGQHILKNPGIVEKIVEKSGVRATDVVLEIGPGTGNLTMRLLEKCKRLIAIELDPRMVAELQKRTSGSPLARKLKIIQGDFLRTELPFFNLCVANIPFQISSPLVFKLLTHRPQFRSAVLMFQKEFAQRVTAPPGSNLYCRLSVNCQLLAKTQHLLKVDRKNFKPPPNVDSAVVLIQPYQPAPPVNFIEWDGMIRLLFQRRNKTIRASFNTKKVIALVEQNYKTLCSLQNKSPSKDIKSELFQFLETSGMGSKRSSKLSIPDLLQLLDQLNQRDIHFKDA